MNKLFYKGDILMITIYDELEIRNDYRQLTKLLIKKDMTIATMESATAGQMSKMVDKVFALMCIVTMFNQALKLIMQLERVGYHRKIKI